MEWGGECKCPNGKIRWAAAIRGSNCGKISCNGGTKQSCNKSVGRWSYHKVHCGVNFLFQFFIYY